MSADKVEIWGWRKVWFQPLLARTFPLPSWRPVDGEQFQFHRLSFDLTNIQGTWDTHCTVGQFFPVNKLPLFPNEMCECLLCWPLEGANIGQFCSHYCPPCCYYYCCQSLCCPRALTEVSPVLSVESQNCTNLQILPGLAKFYLATFAPIRTTKPRIQPE